MSERTVLLVDDEPLARKSLQKMLAPFSDLRIIGEAGRLEEAREFVLRQIPDVVFLDIQLFAKSGFDLLPSLPDTTKVIFVTAYDTFAVRAFEVNALDYLLKPIDPARLTQAVERLRQAPGTGPATPPSLSLKKEDTILVQAGDRRRLLPLTQVRAITADGEYSEVHPLEGPSALLRKSLKHWENDLPADTFVRIHRNAIINLAYIERVQEKENGTFLVFVRQFATPFESSRRMSSEFEKRLLEKELAPAASTGSAKSTTC
jgi:two-component system LytT family response regulator